MLTQLATLKARLAIDESDVQSDSVLTNTLLALGRRFDNLCNRVFARTVGATYEFSADDLEIIPLLYPIESVTRFETKEDEASGWVEHTDVGYLIRGTDIITLASPLGDWRQLARITYTGGYVLPGATPSAGQTPLPEDIEQAAVEQAASWFQNRDKLGLTRSWPHEGTYQQFLDLELLPEVKAALRPYIRWTI
jgi:hypothetical protein